MSNGNDPKLQAGTAFTKSVTLAGGLQDDVPEFLQELPTSAYVENGRFVKEDEIWKALPDTLSHATVGFAKFIAKTEDGYLVGAADQIVEYDLDGNEIAQLDATFTKAEKLCSSTAIAGACNFSWAQNSGGSAFVLAYETRTGHPYDESTDSIVHVEVYNNEGRLQSSFQTPGSTPVANQNTLGQVLVHFGLGGTVFVYSVTNETTTQVVTQTERQNPITSVLLDPASFLTDKGYNALRVGLQPTGENHTFQVYYPGVGEGNGVILYKNGATGALVMSDLIVTGQLGVNSATLNTDTATVGYFPHDVKVFNTSGARTHWAVYSTRNATLAAGASLIVESRDASMVQEAAGAIFSLQPYTVTDAVLSGKDDQSFVNNPVLAYTLTRKAQSVEEVIDTGVSVGVETVVGRLIKSTSTLLFTEWDTILDHCLASNPVLPDNDYGENECFLALQQMILTEPYNGLDLGDNQRLANNPQAILKPVSTFIVNASFAADTYLVAGLDINSSKFAPSTMQEQVVRTSQLTFETSSNTMKYLNRQLLQSEDVAELMHPPNAQDQSNDHWDKVTMYMGEYKGNLFQLDLSNADVDGLSFGGGVFVNAALPMFFARGKLLEAGVVEQPEILSVTGNTTNLNQRRYSYGAILDADQDQWSTFQVLVGFVDPLGYVHRSAPSLPIHVRGLAPEEIDDDDLTRTLYFTMPLTRYDAQWFVEVYEAPYGEVPRLAFTKGFDPSGDRTETSVQYSGLMDADGDVIYPSRSSEFVYSTNFLSADPWEEYDFIVSTSRRIFFLRDSTVYYTKLFEENTAPERNALLNIPFGRNINLSAIGTIDDKVIVFEPDAIHAIYGDGPDNGGEGGPFIVDKLQTTVGCDVPKSVVELPEGLLFYSSVTDEFHLLDRDFVVRDIGSPVQDLSKDITITAATVFPAEQEVRWYVTGGETEEFGPDPDVSFGVPERPPRPRFQNILPFGAVLVYNYEFGRWSVLSERFATDVTSIDDKLYRVFASNVYVTSENWAGSPRFKLRTPWVRVADMQNHGRIDKGVFLGKYMSDWFDNGDGLEAGDIQITTRYNYEANGNSHTYRWRANQDLGSSSGERLQFSFKPGQPKCQAIQVEVEEINTEKLDDNEPDYTLGRGFVLTALDLKCKLKRGFGDRSLGQQRSK